MERNDKEFPVQKIRSQYTEKQSSALDELKALDAKVKRPANLFAYIFGSIAAIIMGSGMSLVMTDIGATLGIEGTMTLGIVIGVVGMLMAIVNYPIHKRILASRRRKFAAEVIAVSDRALKD